MVDKLLIASFLKDYHFKNLSFYVFFKSGQLKGLSIGMLEICKVINSSHVVNVTSVKFVVIFLIVYGESPWKVRQRV